MTTLSLGPVAKQSRINAIDVARGFALLGILSVNIKFFGEPFGQMMQLTPPEGVGNMVVHYFTKIFCEGKFYPLFSMLFGMGLMLQRGRADEAGRSVYKPYLRRLAALFLIGLSHGLLLWYGDILFIYSLAGTVLLLLSWCRPRTLLIVGGAFLFMSLTLSGAFQALNIYNMQKLEEIEAEKKAKGAEATPEGSGTTNGDSGAKPDATNPAEASATPPTRPEEKTAGEAGGRPESTPETVDAGDKSDAAGVPESASGSAQNQDLEQFLDRTFPPRIAGFFKKLTAGKVTGGPKDALWMAAEKEAYREGGFLSALAFRAMTWGMFLVICVLGFFWQVGALFCLGGALLKLRFFDPDRAHWRKRAIVLGIGVGLPLSLVGVFGMDMFPSNMIVGGVAMNFGVNLGGPLMALAYISVWATLVERGAFAGLTRVLANAGRMALTNYLCQTLICTTIFYWYGFGLFGTFGDVQRLGVVLAVYAVELAWSSWWLARFRFGPMEWLWRTITYWKLQPMKREG